MTRFFTITTAVLTLIIGVLVGVLLSVPRAGQAASPAPVSSSSSKDGAPEPAEIVDSRPIPNGSVNFADIAARLNPAVVNIDATARGRRAGRLLEEGGRRGPD